MWTPTVSSVIFFPFLPFLLLPLNLLTEPVGEVGRGAEEGGEEEQHIVEEGPGLPAGPGQLGVQPALQHQGQGECH